MNSIDYDTLLQIATHRRSIRKFKDDPVSRDDIEKIVTIGMHAPSGFNAQPWDMVVVDDKALKDKISHYLLDAIGKAKTAKGFSKAPAFLILYGDTRARTYAPPAKKDDDTWWKFTLTASLNNAFMSMQLAATSLGLGSMWVSASRNPNVETHIKELLHIPPHFQLYEMLAIGYPDIKTGQKKLRELSNVVHYNQDTNYRTADELDAWF